MKRVLLASTALGMGAGVAFAQDAMMDGPTIGLKGNAEMGVAASKDNSVRFHTDIDFTFTASGTTNGGVMWSAEVDLDEVRNENNGAKDHATANDDEDGGVLISISDPDGFGTLKLGDANGAIAEVVADSQGAGPGSLRDANEVDGTDGNDGLDGSHDGQILLYTREIGSGFSMAASVELDDHADEDASEDPIIGLGGKYEMPTGAGMLAFGAGFQMGSDAQTIAGGQAHGATGDAPEIWSGEMDFTAFGGSVSMDFGNGGDGIKVIADGGIIQGDGETVTGTRVTGNADYERTHLGLGVGYTVGAISLGVNVGTQVWEESHDGNLGSATAGLDKVETTASGVGFTAAYDLGGGAKLKFGVGSSETEWDYTYQDNVPASAARAANGAGHDHSIDTNKWSLGLAFAF